MVIVNISTEPGKYQTLLKIAVTGSAGSGKSVVCRHLHKRGVPMISSDDLAREAVAPGTAALTKIKQVFGHQVLDADGSLKRQEIRRLIIRDRKARKKLEAIVHPEVIGRIDACIAAAEEENQPAVAVEVPLLFELAMEKRFDVVLLVLADREQQIERLVERDGITRREAEALLDIQLPDEIKITKSDHVIYNDRSLEDLIAAVDSYFNLK